MESASAFVGVVAFGTFAVVYFRKTRPDWVVGTGIGLVILNAFAVGLVGAWPMPWSAVVLAVQVVATAVLLISMRREWRQWVADGKRA